MNKIGQVKHTYRRKSAFEATVSTDKGYSGVQMYAMF